MRRRSSFFFLLKMTKGENKKWAWFHSKKDLLHLVERHPWQWLSFLSLNSNHSWRVSIVCKSWMMLRLLLCLECLEGCSFYAVDDRIFLHLLFGRQSHFLPVYCFVMLFLLMFFFVSEASSLDARVEAFLNYMLFSVECLRSVWCTHNEGHVSSMSLRKERKVASSSRKDMRQFRCLCFKSTSPVISNLSLQAYQKQHCKTITPSKLVFYRNAQAMVSCLWLQTIASNYWSLTLFCCNVKRSVYEMITIFFLSRHVHARKVYRTFTSSLSVGNILVFELVWFSMIRLRVNMTSKRGRKCNTLHETQRKDISHRNLLSFLM